MWEINKVDIFEYLQNSIPTDHHRQSRAIDILQEELRDEFLPRRVLDFGCGEGKSIALFEKVLPHSEWAGVDIESSPEVDSRTRQDSRFFTYNGSLLPFRDSSFDLIYSHQVLEHVRHPEIVLAEIKRVLEKGGKFIGQTSQLEPYHSFSLWNFTVYGFKKIVEDAGLKLVKIRPALDGITLIRRAYTGRKKEFERYVQEESPINLEIEHVATNEGKSIRIINYRKLMFCGIFSFCCEHQEDVI